MWVSIMKINSIEQEIIKTYINKNKQDRIIWELGNAEKRMQIMLSRLYVFIRSGKMRSLIVMLMTLNLRKRKFLYLKHRVLISVVE